MSLRIVNPIGKKGEDLAVEYLKKKGYRILERNYRKQYAEIDIIALGPKRPSTGSGMKFFLSKQSESKGVLVFVEVKTRTSNVFGTPLEAITRWKLKPLQKLAEYYSMTHPELPNQLQIDAISITLDVEYKTESIEHTENISGF